MYILIVENGTYTEDTLLKLFFTVLKHRFHHLIKVKVGLIERTFCNCCWLSQYKTKRRLSIEVISTIEQNRKNNYMLCHSSYNNIDILDGTNYVIYNKYNQMNWDICEDYTKNWKFVLETNLIDGTLHFSLVNHSFAHLISTCDGIALGINKAILHFLL